MRGGAEITTALAAEVVDCRDANDDNECEHDRILDGGRSVLELDETAEKCTNLSHRKSPTCDDRRETIQYVLAEGGTKRAWQQSYNEAARNSGSTCRFQHIVGANVGVGGENND